MADFPETHWQGRLSVESFNEGVIREATHDFADDLDFGLQVAHDGRVWVCINGIAWLRFKPVPDNLSTSWYRYREANPDG